MSIKVSQSGLMSPKEQFSFDKKDLFSVGSVVQGVGAATSGGSGIMSGYYYFVKAPFDNGTVTGSTYTSADGLTVVVTTSVAHGITVGQIITISSATNSGYNGEFTITAVTTVSPFTFTYVMTTLATAGSGTLTFSKNTAPYGYGALDIYSPALNRGQTSYGGINWTKGVTFGFRALRSVGALADSNSEFRAFLGNSYNVSGSNATTSGNGVEPTASSAQVGYKQTGIGALVFMCSNGTAVSSVTTSFTPLKDQFYDVIFEVSGGIAKMFVNDVLVGTNTTAPNIVAGVQGMALWVVAENKTPILAPYKEHNASIADYFFAYLS